MSCLLHTLSLSVSLKHYHPFSPITLSSHSAAASRELAFISHQGAAAVDHAVHQEQLWEVDTHHWPGHVVEPSPTTADLQSATRIPRPLLRMSAVPLGARTYYGLSSWHVPSLGAEAHCARLGSTTRPSGGSWTSTSGISWPLSTWNAAGVRRRSRGGHGTLPSVQLTDSFQQY